jgi:hypothetical protein
MSEVTLGNHVSEHGVGVERSIGQPGMVCRSRLVVPKKLQYVGTRAVNQPYLTQVNGYQTVCEGCFAPFPYMQPTDPRFGAVTQFSTGANSYYNGLQLTAMKRLSCFNPFLTVQEYAHAVGKRTDGRKYHPVAILRSRIGIALIA